MDASISCTNLARNGLSRGDFANCVRSPYLLEQPTTDSAGESHVLSRLTSEQSSPASIESGVLASRC